MFTIEPVPRSIICLPTTRLQRHRPSTLTSQTARHSSSGTSSAGRWKQVPELLTSTSTGPSSAVTVSSMPSTLAASVMSVVTAKAPRSPATASERAASRAAIATRAPASPRARASAMPMPRLPPVTTATLPSSRKESRTAMALDYLRAALRVEARRDAARVLAHVRAGGPGVEVDLVGAGAVNAQGVGDGSENSSHGGSFLGSGEFDGLRDARDSDIASTVGTKSDTPFAGDCNNFVTPSDRPEGRSALGPETYPRRGPGGGLYELYNAGFSPISTSARSPDASD